MNFEILGKGICIINRKEKGKNLELKINKTLKKKIYLSLESGLTEGAICNTKNSVVGWWQAKNIHKNPLLIK